MPYDLPCFLTVNQITTIPLCSDTTIKGGEGYTTQFKASYALKPPIPSSPTANIENDVSMFIHSNKAMNNKFMAAEDSDFAQILNKTLQFSTSDLL